MRRFLMGIEQIKATLIDHMGSDLSTVNAARVSFGKKSDWLPESEVPTDLHTGGKIPPYKRLKGSDERLIKYLAKHKHLSPFGHAFASFHVKAPIFVARQMVKHSYLRWNEVSRRYVEDEPEFYTPDAWRGRSADKKQGSDGVVSLARSVEDNLAWGEAESLTNYRWLIEAGVAPEQARMVLPQSTMTEWYWSGSLDAFANMCKLRCAPDTQYESRVVANQISKVMSSIYPVSWVALMESFNE
jgi:thymidylate synthase (FAD)